MNKLEDRIRHALHDVGRPGLADDALLDHTVARARRQRRQRTALVGAVAGTAVLAIAVVVAWPRLGGQNVDVRPADTTTASTPPGERVPPAPSTTTVPAPALGATTLSEVPPAATPSPAVSAPATAAASTPAAGETLPPGTIGALDLLAVRADGTLVEIDFLAEVETVRGSLSFSPAPGRLALAPDRRTFYVGRPSATDERLIDVVRADLGGDETVVADGVSAFALRPDGEALTVAYPPVTDGLGTASVPSRIVERNLRTGTERSWAHPGYELERVEELAYSPDSQKLAYVALFEYSNIRWFALDSAPPAQPLTIQTGTANSVSDVVWSGNADLIVVNRCCGVESTQPPSLLMVRLDGAVLASWPQPADDITIAGGATGWTAIVGPTLVLKSSEETHTFGAYVAAAL